MDTTAVAEPTELADAPAAAASEAPPVETFPTDAVVEQDLLVEDVSIDGMCGVY